MNEKTELIGSKDDLYWVQIIKRGGEWEYTLRTNSEWASHTSGSEVARFNPYVVAQRGGEPFLKSLLNKLNSWPNGQL